MDVINPLTFLSVLVLIGCFLIKFLNIMKMGEVYDAGESIIVLAIATFAYLFIEIGLFLNLNLEFLVYLLLARVVIVLNWFFWFVELLIYTTFQVTEPLERMSKRKEMRRKT